MSAIKTLAHACIKTVDLQKTESFYCGALGMEKLFSFTRKGTVIGYYLKASDTSFVEVFQADDAAPAAGNRSMHHFCLEVESLEPVRNALLDRGYSPGEIKMGADQSWQFWVKDPSGNDVEFHQYTDQSAQLKGYDVEVDW